jgi:Phage integrase, N-terminal SAM-like domain
VGTNRGGVTVTPGGLDGGVRVQIDKQRGSVEAVRLLDAEGRSVEAVERFLQHLLDAGYSPNTAVAYAHDLKHFFEFLAERHLDWQQFRPAVALEFLGLLLFPGVVSGGRFRGAGPRLVPPMGRHHPNGLPCMALGCPPVCM